METSEPLEKGEGGGGFDLHAWVLCPCFAENVALGLVPNDACKFAIRWRVQAGARAWMNSLRMFM